ncbi:FHA domain protein [Minicystis rosea]|nr:FHA domain protein [Minicystis rosea]
MFARHLVGRSSLAHLRIAELSVSAEHAVLSWNGRGWEVQDLGSRNGTSVDGRDLTPGERAPLSLGGVVAFGSAGGAFRLVDAGPPVVMALPEGGGEPVLGEDGMLALPSGDDPEITVYRDAAAEWILDHEGAVERVTSGRQVAVGGRRFALYLPELVAPTLDAAATPLSLAAVTLAFRVSRDEEHVELSARAGARAVDLGARAHHAVLLALSRARLGDAQAGLAESSQGWVYQEEVAQALRIDEPHVNVAVYRSRRLLAAVGILGAAGIVERRRATRQIRIGVARIEIATI